MRAVISIGRIFVFFVLAVFLTNCAVVQKGADILGATGQISESDRQAIKRTSEAVRKSFSDITEEEEYYIGRAVAALILARYPVYKNTNLTRYINTLGNSVAMYSDRPEIYAGYHFLILDSDEVNALAAPSGLVFVTKGLLKRCKDEEMLASILAHEIGHVAAKHGLRSIKKSRLIDAFTIIGQEAVKKYGSEELGKLTNIFEGVLGDIAEKLIENGYDRKFEYGADGFSLEYASETGYNPHGLVDFLQTMADDSAEKTRKGWFKTHPSAEDRIKRARLRIADFKMLPKKELVRTQRFKQAIKSLK
ncbi:M48 family metalloprotease [Acidobacteriota bacterium]